MKMKKLLSPVLAIALLLGICTSAAAAGGAMRCSEALASYLMREEGFSSAPYNDGTGWYIGYGCACDPEDWPDGITEAEASALLREKLGRFTEKVNAFLDRYGLTVSQGQFDALCAMTYNLGAGWLDPGNRLPSYLINGIGNYTEEEIANAFAAWCHFGGQVHEGLLRRRIVDLKLFLYEDYSFTYDGWSWRILDATDEETGSDVVVYKTGALAPGESDAEEEAGPGTQRYDDVAETAWYADYARYLTGQGIFGGDEAGLFRPTKAVTWGEALKLILLTAGYDEPLSPAGAHWADGFRTLAVEEGLIQKGQVRNLNVAITRDEVADLCAAALGLPREADDPAARMRLTRIPLASLADTANGAVLPETLPEDWAPELADSDRESVLALYNAGVLEGIETDGRLMFYGDKRISRAELSSILIHMAEYVKEFFVFSSGFRAPIDFSAQRNPYDPSAFSLDENDRLLYTASAESVLCGIDVSSHQGKIDWKAVAADGIDYAMIRCGYRGYGAKGSLNEDEYFRENIEGALAAGLDVGVYFFSQALTVEEALNEAALTLQLIRDYPITYPVVFDWERMTNAGSRTANPDWDAVMDCAEAFCGAVSAAGYTPMLYFNKNMSYLFLDMERVQAYDNWLAWYHEELDFLYDFQMWQYGDSGKVAGIQGNVDMNVCFKSF